MQVTLSEFLGCLFRDGRVRVPKPGEIPGGERHRADQVLLAFEQEYRDELPATPPPVHLPAAQWAAAMFFRACQFVAFRDVNEETMPRLLAAACPPGDPPSFHYSVDLTFRYLPDLYKLARNAAQQDVLLTHLARWAVDWPLSSLVQDAIDKSGAPAAGGRHPSTRAGRGSTGRRKPVAGSATHRRAVGQRLAYVH
jgi:hypothetical protein